MVNFPGRNDRRRRMLKDEVLSASTSRSAVRIESPADSNDDTPRYSEAAGIENHPQITDFVPRRYGTIVLVVLAGAGLCGLAAAVHYFLLPIAVSRGIGNLDAFDLGARDNLASWIASIVLFLASVFCLMTYSIRRHKIDDIRGRFRIWFLAAIAGLVLSANSVAGLHEAVANSMTSLTGWSALPGGAAWWLLLAGLPLAWVFIRMLQDTRECRVALALLVGAAISYSVSGACYFGYAPTVDARLQAVLVESPLLMGHWLLFAAVIANARFVVLDAQGLVTVRRRTSLKKASRTSAKTQTAAQKSQPATTSRPTLAAIEMARHSAQSAKRSADSSQWVDGSKPERESYDDDDDNDSDDGDRKLSKSDRKRLRKLKAQGRAA
jgi:hypothetical protein